MASSTFTSRFDFSRHYASEVARVYHETFLVHATLSEDLSHHADLVLLRAGARAQGRR
jgi:hypothetical protein